MTGVRRSIKVESKTDRSVQSYAVTTLISVVVSILLIVGDK